MSPTACAKATAMAQALAEAQALAQASGLWDAIPDLKRYLQKKHTSIRA